MRLHLSKKSNPMLNCIKLILIFRDFSLKSMDSVIILNWSILVWVHVGLSSYDSEILIWFPTSYHMYQETPRSAMLDWGVHDPEQFCPFWFNLNRYFIYGSQLNRTMLESQYTLYRGFYDLTNMLIVILFILSFFSKLIPYELYTLKSHYHQTNVNDNRNTNVLSCWSFFLRISSF